MHPSNLLQWNNRSWQTTKTKQIKYYHELMTRQVKGVLQEIVKQVVGSVAKIAGANIIFGKKDTSIPKYLKLPL